MPDCSDCCFCRLITETTAPDTFLNALVALEVPLTLLSFTLTAVVLLDVSAAWLSCEKYVTPPAAAPPPINPATTLITTTFVPDDNFIFMPRILCFSVLISICLCNHNFRTFPFKSP